ncbi:ABC transporter substrate-binding protein [Paenibacillus sp. M1]|uniref:ABC transporter substrate-binding protein n=1 Tax=Paenibacillus haidiansis TaxID=1574488 RepID=A0ABU7VQC7_9BACL
MEAAQRDRVGGDWRRIETLSNGCSLITWNRNKGGPQQSLSFRQAVNLVIDRADMIRQSGKLGYPARSFLPREDTELNINWHDAEAAKQLLEESGYDGTPFLLICKETERVDAEWIKRQCASIGIPVEIRYESKSSIARKDTIRQADALLSCLVFSDDEVCELESYLQEDSMIHQHLEPGLRQWIFRLTDQIYATKSKEKRRALLKQIEYRLQDEAQVLFLVHQKLNTFIHPSVRGLVINNLGWMDFKDIWLTSGQGQEKQTIEPIKAKSV